MRSLSVARMCRVAVPEIRYTPDMAGDKPPDNLS